MSVTWSNFSPRQTFSVGFHYKQKTYRIIGNYTRLEGQFGALEVDKGVS